MAEEEKEDKFNIRDLLKKEAEEAQREPSARPAEAPPAAPPVSYPPSHEVSDATLQRIAATQPITPSDTQGIDMREYWHIVLRHKLLVFFIITATVLIAFLINYWKPSSYSSTASVTVKKRIKQGHEAIDLFAGGSDGVTASESSLPQGKEMKEIRHEVTRKYIAWLLRDEGTNIPNKQLVNKLRQLGAQGVLLRANIKINVVASMVDSLRVNIIATGTDPDILPVAANGAMYGVYYYNKWFVEQRKRQEVYKRIKELKKRRRSLSVTRTPNHPDIKTIDYKIKILKRNLMTVGELQQAVEQLQKILSHIKTIEELKQKVENNPALSERLQGLEDVKRSLCAKYDKTLRPERAAVEQEIKEVKEEKRTKLKQEKAHMPQGDNIELEISRDRQEGDTHGIDIDNRATTAQELPVDVRGAILMALMGGIALAIFMVYVLEHLDDTFSTANDVHKNLGLSTLGIIPKWPKAKDGGIPVIEPDKPKSAMAEIFSVLRNRIRYSAKNNPEKMMLIASALPGEGKSFVATNLGIAYSLEGNKVLLIDGDLRKAGLHQSVEALHVDTPIGDGLRAYLEENVPAKDIVLETSIPGLYVLPTGGHVHNPPKLLANRKLMRLFEGFEREFDMIIIDMPAVLPVVDATIISSKVRAVVLVVAAGHTSKGAAQEAISHLLHVGSPVVGVVLNKVMSKGDGGYYYGYYKGYSGYGYGYGYGEEPDT